MQQALGLILQPTPETLAYDITDKSDPVWIQMVFFENEISS